GMVSFATSSSETYSGGIGGGVALCDLPVNSSRNLATKDCVGQEQASPKAQMVLPAMLSPMVLSMSGSFSVPPPARMRSVAFFIRKAPSRHGVHWPQDSWA